MELTKTDKLASKEKRTNQPDSGAMIRLNAENQKLFCEEACGTGFWQDERILIPAKVFHGIAGCVASTSSFGNPVHQSPSLCTPCTLWEPLFLSHKDAKTTKASAGSAQHFIHQSQPFFKSADVVKGGLGNLR
jgi:hypothetical protein